MFLFNAARAVRQHTWFGWAFGILSFLIALVLRFTLHDTLPPGFPYLTFFPAVILTTFLGGLRPGIASAVASGLAAWYWFIPPLNSFELTLQTAIALGFYVFIVGVDITLIHITSIAADRLRQQQILMTELYDQQRTMFQELQHRVANNMAFIASLLALHKRKVVKDPASAVTALDEAQNRLETISRIHRRLYDPASVDLPVGQYLQEICSDLLEATGAKNIVCLVDVSAIKLDIRKLLTLSLVVTELVTNSLKHAFAGDQKGTITITLERLEADHLALTIRDNGKGYPANFDPNTNKSLGFRIVQGLAAQLHGEISYTNEQGTVTRLTFPA